MQGFLSSQVAALLPVQLPALHASPVVQASPSSQAASTGAWLQTPSLQLSTVQEFLSSQSLAVAPAQSPSLQASPLVHALPSSQAVPEAAGAVLHKLPSHTAT